MEPTANDLYLSCLGIMQAKRYAEAIPALQEFLQYDPSHADARFNLGVALAHTKDMVGARAELSKGLAFKPHNPDILTVLGGILIQQGEYQQALKCLDKALAVAPDKPSARWNRASANLTLGNWEQGWKDYEFGIVNCMRPVRTLLPKWDGKPSIGQHVLVYSEQGFGDTIWASKMLPMLQKMGVSFTLEVQEPLVSLMQASGYPVVAQPTDNSMAVEADCAISLMSLPRVLGLRSDGDVPNEPYLKADQALVSTYKEALPKDRRVGIAWQGRASHDNDAFRSIKPEELSPLAGIRFLGLQKGSENYARLPHGMDVLDFGDCLADFSVTAAIIENLDLVVTVDTAVAHLAGALNKPTILMLPKYIDFRWRDYTDSCPWYPSIRIVRQKEQGDWSTVLDRVAFELYGHREEIYGTTIH